MRMKTGGSLGQDAPLLGCRQALEDLPLALRHVTILPSAHAGKRAVQGSFGSSSLGFAWSMA